jgi:aspartate aminotransferase
VGALHIVNETAAAASAVITQMVRIIRTLYSMPPDHGASIVQEILGTDSLRQMWVSEVDAIRTRITSLRAELVASLVQTCPTRDFGFIKKQRGMFSRLPITPEQAREFRAKHHIYMLEDGRINIAGLRSETVPYVAQAVADIMRR